MIRTTVYAASLSAKSSVTRKNQCPLGVERGYGNYRCLLPRHILGPPLKGKYPHFELVSFWLKGIGSFHLSGRKSSASIPYRSGRRCIVYTLYATELPLGMRTGDVRSRPPPVGRIVVHSAVRALTGTGG